MDVGLEPWRLRVADDDDRDAPLGEVLLAPQILSRTHRSQRLPCRQQVGVGELRPAFLERGSDGVMRKALPDGNGRPLVQQDTHQRVVAARSRLLAANSMTA